MSRGKKLGIIGLLVIIAITRFTNDNVIESQIGDSNNQQSASYLEVNYFAQEDRYYCGQAVVQMVLYMVQGVQVDQDLLAGEMNYIDGGGTSPFNVIKPFKKRNVDIVDQGVFRNLNHLRNSVDEGHYSIINIAFDESGRTGHYVLVTGYDETGFFVNDPWPENWERPTSRGVGEDAYIKTELLQKLWLVRLNWVLTVAKPDSNDASSHTHAHLSIIPFLISRTLYQLFGLTWLR
jgi:hypothetical protein